MSATDPKRCHYCDSGDTALRPYGPGGAWVCFPCATHPDREQETAARYGALLDAAVELSPDRTAVIGGVVGPQPHHPGDLPGHTAPEGTP